MFFEIQSVRFSKKYKNFVRKINFRKNYHVKTQFAQLRLILASFRYFLVGQFPMPTPDF